MIRIRRATDTDRPGLWAILKPIFRAGDTYTVETDIPEADALAFWLGPRSQVFVAEADGVLLGTYYLKPNQGGGGDHVCNCGFATAPAARGQGIARAMLDHALAEATAKGFAAMQFNFVVSTNTRAIAIWEGAGFKTVGRLPRAFRHPSHGLVDALVMWKDLPQDI